MKKIISIVTPVFNEEQNVQPLYEQVSNLFDNQLIDYSFEYIFIDNNSTDNTVSILREMAQGDKRIKVILNARNFGQIRSPYYALFQSIGDATVLIVADLQEDPNLILNFISEWEKGYLVVAGVKNKSEENFLMFGLRQIYYNLIQKFSDVEQIKNFTGFGLYDRSVISALKQLNDPYPYLRGMITELGFKRKEVKYTQRIRKHGSTKNNFYSLFDFAMLGFVNHSKIPLRISIFLGFIISFISILFALFYLVMKLLYWDNFQAGAAPMIIGLFMFSSIQLIFIGIIGEYVGAIYTQVKQMPLVIEKERINFTKSQD
jgi:polyisoprenyl-phosphate glycosyltransferase